MTAEEVKRILQLEAHPREGGWFVQSYTSPAMLPASVFANTAYPAHYAGGPVEMLQLLPGGAAERYVLGRDLEAGERPQVVVPKGVWQGSRLLKQDGDENEWALLGCTVHPGFEYADYETGFSRELISGWPAAEKMIRALVRGGCH